MDFTLTPIGEVRNDRTDIDATDHWAGVRSTIVVDERFGDDCMRGLSDFSHVDVFFVFDRLPEPEHYTAGPARGRADLPPVGVFTGHGPRRPNRLGMTTCRVVSVDGRELTVLGLDAVAGTPVVDIKPTMIEFQPVDVRQPEWVGRLMADYFR